MDPEQSSEPGQGVTPEFAPSAERRPESALLGRELGGDLPCVVCGYNLRGLSIRGVCPECGSGVRATILAVVDPHATILRPIYLPRFVAGGLVVWALSGLVIAIVLWWPHFAAAAAVSFHRVPAPDLSLLLVALVACWAAGAASLVRPHGGIPWWYTVAAVCALALHAPMGWALLHLYRTDWPASAAGTRRVFVAMACLAAIFVLLRPTARLLVARSLLLRSGRVDRQTLYGMAAAALLVAIGHGIIRFSVVGWVGGQVVVRVLGVALLVIGAALLTLGLIGCVIDSVRIARAILRPRRTLKQVLRSGIGPEPDPIT
jgi:hypothetical protein